MAASSKGLEYIDLKLLSTQFFKCCLCKTPLNEVELHPKLLSCLHWICFDCTQTINQTKTKGIHCNCCKEKSEVSELDISAFQDDNTKSALLKLFRCKNSELILSCQECEETVDADYHCEKCSNDLCNNCHWFHTQEKHIVHSLQDLPSSVDKVKKIFCQEKSQPSEHQKEYSKLLTGKSVIENKESKIDKTVHVIEKELTEIKSNSDNVSKEIETAFKKASQILEDQKNGLLVQLKRLKERKTSSLEDQILHLQRQKQDIKHARNFLRYLTSSSDISVLRCIVPTIEKRFTHLSATSVDSMPKENACFKYLDTDVKNSPSILGKLLSSPACGPNTRVTLPEVIYEGEDKDIYIQLRNYHDQVILQDDIQVSADVLEWNDSIVVSHIPCNLQERGMWNGSLKISQAGKYKVEINVLGCKLQTQPMAITVENVPIMTRAQMPVKETKKNQATSTSTRTSEEFVTREKSQLGSEKMGAKSKVNDELGVDSASLNNSLPFGDTFQEVVPKETNHDQICFPVEKCSERMDLTIFEFYDRLKVYIYTENLVSLQNVDAVVSPENLKISGTGELAKVLLEKGGKKYAAEHGKLFSNSKSIIQQGHVLVTNAGHLPYRNIYHVVIERFPSNKQPTPYHLKQQENAVRNVLEKANLVPLHRSMLKRSQQKKKRISTIAMPLLGTGNLSTPLYVEKHCRSVYDAIAFFAEFHYRNNSLQLKEIHLVNLKPDTTNTMQKVFTEKSLENKTERIVKPSTQSITPALATSTDPVEEPVHYVPPSDDVTEIVPGHGVCARASYDCQADESRALGITPTHATLNDRKEEQVHEVPPSDDVSELLL